MRRSHVLRTASPTLAIVIAAIAGCSSTGDDPNRSSTASTPGAGGSSSGSQTVPDAPALPRVAPTLPDVSALDLDGDRVEDSIVQKTRAMRAKIEHAGDAEQRSRLQAEFDEPVAVEVLFSGRVTRTQMGTFLALGGRLDHLYKAIGYGWVGAMPRGTVDRLARELGSTLVLIHEARPLELHLDEATQTGRVRSVWASPFGLSATGYNGDPNTTILVMDTGVDGTHTDLSGRNQYWADYTGEAEPTPIDKQGHGTHVAGIATGTGAAFGVGPGTLYLAQNGNLSGVAANAFFPMPTHLPASAALTATAVVNFVGTGTPTIHLASAPDGTTTYASHGAAAGSSGVTFSKTIATSTARTYSFALLSNTTVTNFSLDTQWSNYPAVGDGFNAMSGVCPDCKWAGAKVFTNAGTGLTSYAYAALDDAVARASTDNVKVINMSLGLSGGNGLKDKTYVAKVNTAVDNGIVVVVSAGNSTAEMNDPARAGRVITVAASNDQNALTSYSSFGFASIDSDEDQKPDITAPGGSTYRSFLVSADSNSSDYASSTMADVRANNYTGLQGTSMAAPMVAGAAGLVIDALQQAGMTWSFGSSASSLKVKQLLTLCATETNTTREISGNNPTLGRAATPKDIYEGYGLMNPDCSIETGTVAWSYASALTGTTPGGRTDRRAWGRKVALTAYETRTFTMAASGDYDLYLYSESGNANGNPIILASSTAASTGNESFSYTPPASGTGYLVVKRVSGSGEWSVSSTATNCGNGVVEAGEACDDGNHADGDCCSSTCAVTNEGVSGVCSDGNACTQTDTCTAGACVGSNPVTCSASDQCHAAGTCDTGTGVCSNPNAADDTDCSDGSSCTSNDKCQAGVCVGGANTCGLTVDPTFPAGSPVTVNWNDPALTSPTDWIAIATPTSGSNTSLQFQYLPAGAHTTGSLQFTGVAPGNYEARLYYNWPTGGNVVQRKASFTVLPVTTAQFTSPDATIAVNTPIVVNYTGFPTNATDWIALAPQGAPYSGFTQWAYTNGNASGQVTFNPVAAGNWELRAYYNYAANHGTAAETVVHASRQFVVESGTPSITTPVSPVAVNTGFTVTYSGFTTKPTNWIAIAPAGGAFGSFGTRWQYTNGANSGTMTFAGLPAGNYQARAYFDWAGTQSQTVQASLDFTVAAAGATFTGPVVPVASGSPTIINYSGFPGNQTDWIAIAPPGGNFASFGTRWQYLNGSASGAANFGVLPAGTYEARGYLDWNGTHSQTTATTLTFTVLP